MHMLETSCETLTQQILAASINDLKQAVSALIGLDGIVELPNAERSAIINGGIHTLNEIILDEPIDLCLYDVIHLLSLASCCKHIAMMQSKQGEPRAEIMAIIQNVIVNLVQLLTNFDSK